MGAAKSRMITTPEARAKSALENTMDAYLAEKRRNAPKKVPAPVSSMTFKKKEEVAAFNEYVKEFISKKARAAIARKEFPANTASLQGRIKGIQFLSKLVSEVRTSAQYGDRIQISEGFSVTPKRLSQGVAKFALDFLYEDPDYKSALVSEDKRWQSLTEAIRQKHGKGWVRNPKLRSEASKFFYENVSPKIKELQPLFYEAVRFKEVLGKEDLKPIESLAKFQAQGRAGSAPDVVAYSMKGGEPTVNLVKTETKKVDMIDADPERFRETLMKNKSRVKRDRFKGDEVLASRSKMELGPFENTYVARGWDAKEQLSTDDVYVANKSRAVVNNPEYLTSTEEETYSLERNKVKVRETPGRKTDLSLVSQLDTDDFEIEGKFRDELNSTLGRQLESAYLEDPEINESLKEEIANFKTRTVRDKLMEKYLPKIMGIREDSVIRKDAEGYLMEILQQGQGHPNARIDRNALAASVTRLGALLKTSGFRALPYIGILSDLLQAYQISEEQKERQAKFNKTYYQ